MSEKKANLTDFFNKASKKKPAPKAAKEAPAGGEPDHLERQPAKDPAAAQAHQQKKTTDYESSDDEKPDLILTNDDSLLLDKKEAEAKRSKQQAQADSAAGWRALDASASDKPTASLNAEPTRGPPKGVAAAAKSNTIDFKSGAPMKFTNKKKKIDEEFPELGHEQQAAAKQGGQPARATNEPLSKKDAVDIDIFGRGAAVSTQQPAQTSEEKKEAPKMPMFTSSKKKRLDVGDQVDAIQSSKQNYDFSAMHTSAATSKVFKKDTQQQAEGAEGTEESKGAQQPKKPAEPLPQ